MGGPAARLIDDALQIGLVFRAWPFSHPPGALPARELRYLMERTEVLMPAPPGPDEEALDV